MYKLLVTYQEEWEKQTINNDLFLSVVGVYVVRTSSLNDKHSCQLFRKASSLVLSSSVSTANLSCLLATTFSNLRFFFNFTSLQSFESGQRVFLFSHFRVLTLNPQPFFPLFFRLWSSVYSKFVISKWTFLFRHDKAALESVVEINNTTGVTGQSLPPKNDFEHARGLRNSAYAVNLTYETYRHTYIYHAKSQLNTPVWGSLRSPNYELF